MAFTNSPLAALTLLSPNKTSPRNHAIDTITIHCVVGQLTAKRICELFQPASRQASCNYAVGCDGSIALCVDEADRSWCSGGTLSVNGITGKVNDHRAVTIEVASDTTHPYAVTDAAYDALIRLVADIAERNGLYPLKWKADKTLVGKPQEQNMTVHRWFANKACPGDFLYTRMGEIAQKANAIIEAKQNSTLPDGLLNQPADWAAKAWTKAHDKGVMDGTRPAESITRQEVAVVLDRLGLLEGSGQ